MQYKTISHRKMTPDQKQIAITVSRTGNSYLTALKDLREEASSNEELNRAVRVCADSIYGLISAAGLVDENDPVFEFIKNEKTFEDAGGDGNEIVVIEPPPPPPSPAIPAKVTALWLGHLKKKGYSIPMTAKEAVARDIPLETYFESLTSGSALFVSEEWALHATAPDGTAYKIYDDIRSASVKERDIAAKLEYKHETTPETKTFADRRQHPYPEQSTHKKVWISYKHVGRAYTPLTVKQCEMLDVDPKSYYATPHGVAWFWTEKDAKAANSNGYAIDILGRVPDAALVIEKTISNESRIITKLLEDHWDADDDIIDVGGAS
jgi:hypothetical protein